MSSSSNQITIQSLKDEVPPQSPKKYEGTQCCAVVTKSPLKSTCYGKMFSMNLCGKDSCTTIQAVCFDDSMFEEFKAKQSYDVESFRLKKGFGTSSNEVEVLIDHSTSVEESPDQFAVEKKCFNIAAILRKESQVFHFIDITAKVISIGDICVIKKTLDNIEKRDVELADESGVITMVLWRQRAENFNFKVNDVLHLENMVTTIFNNKVMLSTTFESSMVKVEEDIKVPAIEKLQSQKRSLISTSETSVLAVKDFKAAYKCLSCKADIQPRKTGSDALITCPTCSTSFLACTGSISSECMVLLSCDHQWYSANTGVILHMFDWKAQKMRPTEQDLINILKSQFSVRLDLKRRVIEHVQEIQNKKSKIDDFEPTPEEEEALLNMEIDECGKGKEKAD